MAPFKLQFHSGIEHGAGKTTRQPDETGRCLPSWTPGSAYFEEMPTMHVQVSNCVHLNLTRRFPIEQIKYALGFSTKSVNARYWCGLLRSSFRRRIWQIVSEGILDQLPIAFAEPVDIAHQFFDILPWFIALADVSRHHLDTASLRY